MVANSLNLVLHHLRQKCAREQADTLQDHLLLGRFIADQDEAAFETILARHGPMVLAVCRRVLRNESAVEDAFQATFLILVRKAGSIRKRELLATWLYGVALRTASRAKVDAAKRRARESAVLARQPADFLDDMSVREMFAVLDEELAGLPAKYRAPLILCCLENQTRDEAARQMRCSKATLDRRMERGRAMLGDRLRRRGLTLAVPVVPILLTQAAASGAVPFALAMSTAKAVGGIMAGTSALSASPEVMALTKGVLRAMSYTKIKMATIALVVLVGLTAGVGTLHLIWEADAGQTGSVPKASPAPEGIPGSAVTNAGSKPIPLPEYAQPKDDSAKKTPADIPDAERILGRWITHDDNGRRGLTAVFVPNKLTILGARQLEFWYKLDPSQTPKQIDYGEFGDRLFLKGIYEFQGDRLLICRSYQKRPTKFMDDADSGTALFVYERDPTPDEKNLTVSSEVEAKITEVLVKAGDKVRAGSILVRLDDRHAKLDLREAEARVKAAQGSLGAAIAKEKEALTRWDINKGLFTRGSCSKEDLRTSELTCETLTAEKVAQEVPVEIAKIHVERMKLLLEMYAVASPVDGTIVTICKRKGETVKKGEPLLKIEPPSAWKKQPPLQKTPSAAPIP